MKLSQISSKEIEMLKGKCIFCRGEGGGYIGNAESGEGDGYMCEDCQGSGQATIEIEKEWVESKELCDCEHKINQHKKDGCNVLHREGDDDIYCDCETTFGKIPKYKIGDEINVFDIVYPYSKSPFLSIKIISETEKTWKVVMVK